MKPALFALFCLFFCAATPLLAAEPDLNELVTPAETGTTTPLSRLCLSFNTLNSLIRDGRISTGAARAELRAKLAAIHTEYYRHGGRDYPAKEWIFPVAGYTAGAIDKGRNHGFVPNGYNYFSGNRHGGHPAYDIFIHDRNQDCLDDRDGAAIRVLSMTGGVVVALEKRWEQGSKLRGGKYIWIYDPGNQLLVYYAHNEKVFVEPGMIVRPGDLVATVGRSGFNAAKRRSPTHLHFSVLRVRDGVPVPLDIYQELRRAASAPPLQDSTIVH